MRFGPLSKIGGFAAAFGLALALVPGVVAKATEAAPEASASFAFVQCNNECVVIGGTYNCQCQTIGTDTCYISTPHTMNCQGAQCHDSNNGCV